MITIRRSIAAVGVLVTLTLQAADIDGSITHDDQVRTYYLHTPPQYNGEDPLPLLIALHFYGGNGSAMAATTGLNTTADQEGFIAVYPDALGSPPSWDMYGDVEFISALIDSLSNEYALDTMRIYATGYSNGAFMAHVLAADLSTRIAAVSMIAGGLMITYWWEFKLDRDIPTIHFHARDDAVVPYEGSQGTAPVEEMLASWATQNGCTEGPDSFWDASGALRQTWSNPENDVENVLWSTDEGGHYNWPSLTSPHQISANDLMWDFFVNHPMPVQEPGISEVFLEVPIAFEVGGLSSGSSAFVRFTLDQTCYVAIEFYDVAGSKRAELFKGWLKGGLHEIQLDDSGFSSGIYFCRLSTPRVCRTLPVRLIK